MSLLFWNIIGQDVLQSEKLSSPKCCQCLFLHGYFCHLTEDPFLNGVFLQLVNVFKMLTSLHRKPRDESFKEPLPADLWIQLEVN